MQKPTTKKRKLRSDSSWRGLSDDQMDLLQSWLFEQKLSYNEVLQRVEKEFGIKSSATSLRRFYHQIALERKNDDFIELVHWAPQGNEQEVAHTDKGVDAALRTVLNIAAYQMAIVGPDQMNTRELRRIMQTINESRRETTRQQRVELDRKRVDTSCLIDLAKHIVEMRAQAKKAKPVSADVLRALKNGSLEQLMDAYIKPAPHGNEAPVQTGETPSEPEKPSGTGARDS